MKHTNQPHRVIIEAREYYETITNALRVLQTDNSPEELHAMFNELVHGMIECRFRYKEQSMSELICFVRAISNMYDGNRNREVVVFILGQIKLLGLEILFQMEAMRLYDDKGLLMYSHRPVRDLSFREIALDYTQRLTWNHQFYEPISSIV